MSNKEFISMSLKTIFEMLYDRKIIDQAQKENMAGFSEYSDSIQNKLSFTIQVTNNVKILYYLPAKFKWSELKKCLEDTQNEDATLNLLILVVREKVSQNNMKLINGFIGETIKTIQVFDIKELQFNISHHILVPRHEILFDEQEVKDIINRYSLKSKFQLPHILRTDPMSKYLGLKGGDVVKITRVSQTAGEYITYRCCL